MNIVSSWSGGKDSCYALIQAVNEGHTPSVLLNMMNENGKLSRSHGIPLKVLQKQAAAMNLPIHAVPSSWSSYEPNFIGALQELKSKFHLQAAVFGDIDLQAHRDWEENVCNKVSMETLLPLWQKNRKSLVVEMLGAGLEAIIVSCTTIMGPEFLGQTLDFNLIERLEQMGIDPCGENGEYHTLVTYCSLFKNRIQVVFGEKKLHNDYYFIDMIEEAGHITP